MGNRSASQPLRYNAQSAQSVSALRHQRTEAGMVWLETLSNALTSLRAYRLRTALTLLSVAIGVFAIVLAGTANEALDRSVMRALEMMGENTFSISRRPAIIVSGEEWRRIMKRPPIDYRQAVAFKREMSQHVPWVGAWGEHYGERIRAGNRLTDPDVSVSFMDPECFAILQWRVAVGRVLTSEDVALVRPVAVLGADVAEELFGSDSSAIGQEVRIQGYPFTVVGVLQPQGKVLGQSLDNFVVLPLPWWLRFKGQWTSLDLLVQVPMNREPLEVMDEAIAILRRLRGLKPWEPNNFELITRESAQAQFASFSRYIGFFGMAAGGIALLAAGVGVMNIMLVAVRERTREIGIRKAVGARRRWILQQFLVEALAVTLIGGLIGVLLGFAAGAGLGSLIGLPLSVPWQWVTISVVLCAAVGVGFGSYPAWKAATLNPVDALRYE